MLLNFPPKMRPRCDGTSIASLRLVLAVAIASLMTGCAEHGVPRSSVCGTVYIGVEPLTAGMIRFIPTGETKGPAAFATIRDGFYEMPVATGPVVGTHRVEIDSADYFGFALDDEAAFTRMAIANGGRLPPNPVPAMYRKNSPLTAEVPAEGLLACDFVLTALRPRHVKGI